LGTLNRESEIAQVYQAADLFVTPSQQDNFPNTVLEAISTGVPTVAFEVGGIPEMVKHKEHGYIAKAFDTSDFADGIEWCIESEDRLRLLGEKAREYAAKSFSPEIISKRYLDLYSELLSERRNS
jgi:glycosyltransferase involved in cell wall biosynthesis